MSLVQSNQLQLAAFATVGRRAKKAEPPRPPKGHNKAKTSAPEHCLSNPIASPANRNVTTANPSVQPKGECTKMQLPSNNERSNRPRQKPAYEAAAETTKTGRGYTREQEVQRPDVLEERVRSAAALTTLQKYLRGSVCGDPLKPNAAAQWPNASPHPVNFVPP